MEASGDADAGGTEAPRGEPGLEGACRQLQPERLGTDFGPWRFPCLGNKRLHVTLPTGLNGAAENIHDSKTYAGSRSRAVGREQVRPAGSPHGGIGKTRITRPSALRESWWAQCGGRSFQSPGSEPSGAQVLRFKLGSFQKVQEKGWNRPPLGLTPVSGDRSAGRHAPGVRDRDRRWLPPRRPPPHVFRRARPGAGSAPPGLPAQKPRARRLASGCPLCVPPPRRATGPRRPPPLTRTSPKRTRTDRRAPGTPRLLPPPAVRAALTLTCCSPPAGGSQAPSPPARARGPRGAGLPA
ncbi:PREDICTED: basic salivary proline-rich protein 3-like [Lipotes vexillifer]|uniref:Basic salivary proline-rich protein 3-like n=1 Tax=Lipotes vexillifer TaxID=118797 RepID=A0A340WUP8_LIPVE|nr:PREDICTED: basic salivary proline-rich protein 3-like [Lipotes vexillifer]